MRFLIPGGSGQIGTLLARSLHARGHHITILSRSAPRTPNPWPTLLWDARTLGPWASQLNTTDIVINLTGRSVDCRYTPANRRDIMNSRVDSTRVIGEAIAAAATPPRLWLQASTATIYAHRFDGPNDEHTGLLGGDEPDAPDTWRFSIQVARAWEHACTSAHTPHTRKVLLRSAMTMSPDRGGVFDVLLSLVRRGLGGPVAGGRQFVSWIHDADFLRAIDHIIATDSLSGPVNISAPNPLPYADFMRHLRAAANVRIGLPATRWMLELGTLLMRTESELVLKSRRVTPARLIQTGFTFSFPSWPEAAIDLCSRRLRQNAAAPASATA